MIRPELEQLLNIIVDMARYYVELLITYIAAGSFVWLATQCLIWWRRLLYTVAFEVRLILLTFSGCDAMSNFPGQTRPVSAIGDLSLSELWWIFGLMFSIAACLAIVKLLPRVSSRWRIVGKVAIYGFVSLSAFVLCVQGCDEGCMRRFPIAYAPDRKRFARVQEIDAGAMDSFHTTVMLRTRDRMSGVQIFGSHDGT